MKPLLLPLTLLVFLVSCWTGLSMARQKPLWNDELYSETIDVPSSYWDIVVKQSPIEGNKAPAYYFPQKLIEQLFSFRVPETVKPPDLYFDKRAQIICRINSIFWMSLSIALIFYFFTRTTALWAGVSALLITLSTFMVWSYWAEDRIYALWFFLTIVQGLIVSWSSQDNQRKSNVLGWLALTNILLSLTTTLGAVQIAACAVWLYFSGHKKIKDHLLTAAIPVAICLFYYTRATQFSFVFPFPAWKLITANVPLERILLMFAALLWLWKGAVQPSTVSDKKGDWRYLSYLGLTFLAGVGLVVLFKMKSGSLADERHCIVHARHVLFLAPIGIMAAAFLFVRLMEKSRSLLFRGFLILLLLTVTVPRIWKYAHFSYGKGGPIDSGVPLQ